MIKLKNKVNWSALTFFKSKADFTDCNLNFELN
jgi:hypothetical protein